MKVSDINNRNWQLSLGNTGIVTGVDDIRQCIATILTTRKGQDPLRPHFGCGLHDYVDKPVNSAIPKMKKEILSALSAYEKRIKVTRITAEVYSD